MNLNHPLSCQILSAVLPYEVCLRRQSAMMKENSKCQHSRYPVCHFCDEGKKIRAKFPDWKYIKDDKRRKPERFYLHKKSGSRAALETLQSLEAKENIRKNNKYEN